MATTTTNFGWDIPQSTDLVKDGATAIAALGQDIDTALVDLKGGTTGQVLAKATNADLDFSWVAQDDSNAIQNTIVDAKGDLIAATGSDTPARLAVGTNGQVLTADSAEATGLKWATATASSGPAFSASPSSAQAVSSGSYVKLNFGTENFDTAGNFASSRFTPTTAGYYQINFSSEGSFSTGSRSVAALYKNGSYEKPLGYTFVSSGPTDNGASGSIVINMNGSTDYLEIYAFVSAGTWTFSAGQFSGVWVRGL
jgi:hypothetical protein